MIKNREELEAKAKKAGVTIHGLGPKIPDDGEWVCEISGPGEEPKQYQEDHPSVLISDLDEHLDDIIEKQ